jgi:hypothetical protein
MASIGDLIMRVVADMKGFRTTVEKEATKTGEQAGKNISKGLSSKLAGAKGGILQGLGLGAGLGIANAAAAATGAVVDFAFKSIEAASNLNEAMTKSQAVFKDSADEVEAWAGTASEAFGQSKRQALDAAGTFGNLIQAFGVGSDKAAEMSMSLTELASDLASFNDSTVDEALLALRSGISGESEPLKRFGVALSEVRIKQKALDLGLVKTTKGTLPIAIKTQAAYALILQDTTLAQGDFANTSDSLANIQRTLQGTMEDVQAEVGEALLPVMVELAKFMRDSVLPTVKDVIQALKDAGPVFDALGFAMTALGGPGAQAEKMLRDQEKAVAAVKAATEAYYKTLASGGQVHDDWSRDVHDAAIAADMAADKIDTSFDNVGDSAYEMSRKVKTAEKGIRDASQATVDALVADAQALIDGFFNPLETREELRQARQRLHAGEEAARNAKTKTEYNDAKADIVAALDDEATALKDLGVQNALTQTDVDGFVKDTKAGYKSLGLSVPKSLKPIEDALRRIAGYKGGTIKMVVTGGIINTGVGPGPTTTKSGSGGSNPNRRASGGPVFAGHPYLVGENGPEFMVPGVSGRMMSAGATAQAGGGSGYTDNSTTTIVAPLMPIKSVPDAVRELRRVGQVRAARAQF